MTEDKNSDNALELTGAESTDAKADETKAAPDAAAEIPVITREQIEEEERRSIEIITGVSDVFIDGFGSINIAPITPKIRQEAQRIRAKKFTDALKDNFNTEHHITNILKQNGELPADIEKQKSALQAEAVRLQVCAQNEIDAERRAEIIRQFAEKSNEFQELVSDINARIGTTAESIADEWKYAYLISELCTLDGKKIPGMETMQACHDAYTQIANGLKFHLTLAINLKMDGYSGEDAFFAGSPDRASGKKDTSSPEA